MSNSGQFKGSIAALTLIEQGSANTFDSFDERMNWRNNTTGARAWILPYGQPQVGNEVSWAGLVNDETAAATDWSLRSRQLAINPGTQYKVCFEARSYPATPGSPGLGRIQVGDGAAGTPGNGPVPPNQLYIDKEFEFTNNWKSFCFPEDGLSAPVGDNLVQFAHLVGEPEYLIDNVWIQQQ